MSIDSNPLLANTAKPLFLWVKVHLIKQNIVYGKELKKFDKETQSPVINEGGMLVDISGRSSGITEIRHILKEFMTVEAITKDPYQDKMGTYALMIFKDIADDKNMLKQADALLSATMKATLNAVQNINVNTATVLTIRKRAWNRYVYAAANYFKANTLAQAGDHQAAGAYYKTAFGYSPDLSDLSAPTDFLAEVQLFGNKQPEFFQLEYVNYLKKYGNKNQILSALTQMALRNPVDHKVHLSDYYALNFARQASFNGYWHKAINTGLDKAPALLLEKTDGHNYSSAENAGKWILVDFWGTWCGPCRIEHPALQKLHLMSVSNSSSNLDIITIACNDTKEKVFDYMKDFKYTFPVAMGDQKTVNAFNVHGYPTKALITPEGNYMFIPFNSDWIKFIERYTED